MSRLTALVYCIVYFLALPVIVLRLLVSPGRARVRQRLAFALPPRTDASIWLHASSVGEVTLLEPVVAALERAMPKCSVFITAATATGISTAQQRFSEHTISAVPFDFRFAVERYIRRVNPKLCVVMESEFWPVLFSALSDANVPVAVLNGKMSQRSMLLHLKTRFVAQALRTVALIAAQDEHNAERFRQLGVESERIHATGNMKYDLVTPETNIASRAALGIREDATVIVGGSLHDAEDAAFLDAVFQPEPVAHGVAVLLAPRYTETAANICEVARQRGLRAILKTTADKSAQRLADFDICVIDTLGELRSLYSIADIVFVGGSLFSRGSTKGGHNLMEPAICGVPVLFGPFNHSFAQVARELERAGGGRMVSSAGELREVLRSLCADPDAVTRMGAAARAVVLAGRGGTARNLSLVQGLLEQRSH